MASISAINVNVDTKTKIQATAILKDLGLNMSTAINVFLNQVVKRNGIPFEITNPTPSDELIQALKEADNIAAGKTRRKSRNNVEEMFEDILSE